MKAIIQKKHTVDVCDKCGKMGYKSLTPLDPLTNLKFGPVGVKVHERCCQEMIDKARELYGLLPRQILGQEIPEYEHELTNWDERFMESSND